MLLGLVGMMKTIRYALFSFRVLIFIGLWDLLFALLIKLPGGIP